MRRSITLFATALIVLVCFGQRTSVLHAAGTAQSAATHGADRNAIGEAYAAWAQATNAKDMTRWASFLAPEALFLPPNHVALQGGDAIRSFYADLFADRLFALTCRQHKVEVATSGDFAWSTGSCEATFTGHNGEAAHDRSKWVKVWKKQSNGEWRCLVNSWSSDLP